MSFAGLVNPKLLMMTGEIMKEIKLSRCTPAMIAIFIVAVGFSGCASLEAPTDTGSATPGKFSKPVLYQQPVEEGKLVEPANQASLGGASDPNWGPLPLTIGW